MRIQHQKRYVKLAFSLITFILLLSSSSCGKVGTVGIEIEHLDEAIKTLDTGINTLGKESGNWRKTLEDVRDKTAADVQSTIKTEINNLIDHGVSVIGQESKCDIDFVAKRSRLELIRIKNELIVERNGLAQRVGISPIPSSAVPPVTPFVCIVSPSSLDLTTPPDRRNKIDISGYDFDSEPVIVLLKNSDQEINVTQYLAMPSAYSISLNLGGQGVPLSSNSQKFIVRADGKEISSINILQPSATARRERAETSRQPASSSVLYRMPDGTFVSANDSGAFCTFVSPAHFAFFGGRDDLVRPIDADKLALVQAAMTDDGPCAVRLPAGAYRLVDGRIIASDGSAFCRYTSFEHYERKDGRPIKQFDGEIPLYAMEDHFDCAQ